MPILPQVMVGVGAVALIVSCLAAVRIRRRVSRRLRGFWFAINGMMGMFALAYLAHFYQLVSHKGGTNELLVSSVFLGGAIFVLLVTHLSYVTVASEQRTAELEQALARERSAKIQLQRTQDFLNRIVASIDEPFMVLDRDYRVLLANEAARSMAGGVDPVAEGLCCHQISHQRDEPCKDEEHPCPLRDVFATGQVQRVEHAHRTSAGQERLVEVTAWPIFDEQGQVIQVIEYCRDRTQARHMERELAESEDRFRSIAMSTLDAILMLDGAGNISFWNPAAEKLLGYGAEEVMGRNLHLLLAPRRFHKAHLSAFPRFRRAGKGPVIGRVLELSAQRKDGSELPIELSVSALRQGGHWGAVGVMRDITERKRVEEGLREAKRKSEEADRAKSEFLANMSHEIRTPMNGIIGMSELLLDSELSAYQRDCAETVRGSARALLGIVNDILDFSKIEAGRIDMERTEFHLAETLEESTHVLAMRAQEKGIELVCLVDPEVPARLCGDPGRLRQILTNLVGNAIKFTERGQVAIEVGLEERDGRGALLRFQVRDTGIGIPQGRLDSLFEAFTQADASTSRRFGGTGLGLTISKRLVERMGGDIGVESELGRGSTFWFTVRLEVASAAATAAEGEESRRSKGQRAAPAGPGGSAARSAQILLAEDNPVNQKVAASILAKLGHSVQVVGTGAEALRALRDRSFDLVLMDVQMPELDGLEAARRIRGEGSEALDPRVPIVALTAHAMPGDRERVLDAGMDDFLAKPILPKGLQRVVERWVGGERAEPAKGGYERSALLERLGGDEELLREVLEAFVADAPRRLEALARGLEEWDAESVRYHAHTLKGAAINLGAEGLAEVAAKLEKLAERRDLEEGEGALGELREVFEAVREGVGERGA